MDDLAEVLTDARFPAAVTGIWFAATQPADAGRGLIPHRSWAEITSALAKYS